jgi:methylenetetrahydrofolate reductase (NADPH)
MRIVECFASGQPVFSFEFSPPKTEEAARKLWTALEELATLKPSFVSVTYGAGGSSRQMTIDTVSRIKKELGIEAMAHLTCVGHGRQELAGILDRIHEAGIENLLALRGDPPRGSTEFVRPADGFAYSQELVRFIRAGWDFCLGGACYPEGHLECSDLEADLRYCKEKVDAGVEFLVSQLFFDADMYFRFVERARAIGITVPIVPGIMPVTDVGQLERLTTMCGSSIPEALRARLEPLRDDSQAVVAAGIDWATEQCRALLAGGAPGIHFYTLNRSLSTRIIYQNLQPAP